MPFLYLEFDPLGVTLYFLILLVAVVIPALILTRVEQGKITGRAWGNMFFLGQAFMLVETKSITQLSLFFGATWLVSSVVITCVLLLAYAANLCAGKIKTNNLLPFYTGLLAALLLDFFFRVPTDTQVHPLMLAIFSTLIACLPIFFGGLIFSLCFRQAKAPALYLSSKPTRCGHWRIEPENLLVCSLVLKNLVMIAMILCDSHFLLSITRRAPGKSPRHL